MAFITGLSFVLPLLGINLNNIVFKLDDVFFFTQWNVVFGVKNKQ